MKAWLDLMRVFAYVAFGGVLLSVFFWSLFPLGSAPVVVATIAFICLSAAVALIGLAIVGVAHLARRYAGAS